MFLAATKLDVCFVLKVVQDVSLAFLLEGSFCCESQEACENVGVQGLQVSVV